MTQAVATLLNELAVRPSALLSLIERPESFGERLGFNSAQIGALRSADKLKRPMRPVTFTTGTTIEV